MKIAEIRPYDEALVYKAGPESPPLHEDTKSPLAWFFEHCDSCNDLKSAQDGPPLFGREWNAGFSGVLSSLLQEMNLYEDVEPQMNHAEYANLIAQFVTYMNLNYEPGICSKGSVKFFSVTRGSDRCVLGTLPHHRDCMVVSTTGREYSNHRITQVVTLAQFAAHYPTRIFRNESDVHRHFAESMQTYYYDRKTISLGGSKYHVFGYDQSHSIFGDLAAFSFDNDEYEYRFAALYRLFLFCCIEEVRTGTCGSADYAFEFAYVGDFHEMSVFCFSLDGERRYIGFDKEDEPGMVRILSIRDETMVTTQVVPFVVLMFSGIIPVLWSIAPQVNHPSNVMPLRGPLNILFQEMRERVAKDYHEELQERGIDPADLSSHVRLINELLRDSTVMETEKAKQDLENLMKRYLALDDQLTAILKENPGLDDLRDELLEKQRRIEELESLNREKDLELMPLRTLRANQDRVLEEQHTKLEAFRESLIKKKKKIEELRETNRTLRKKLGIKSRKKQM